MNYNTHLDIQLEQASLSGAVQNYSANLEEIHTQLKQSIADTQACYKKFTDNRQSPAPRINVGNSVYILAKFIKTTCPSKKLAEKYLGPFEVTNRPGSHSYRVNLPDHLRAIHPVFHISQLEPAPLNQIPNRTNPPLPPIELDSNLKFEVTEVLDSKLNKCRSHPLLYYV